MRGWGLVEQIYVMILFKIVYISKGCVFFFSGIFSDSRIHLHYKGNLFDEVGMMDLCR